MKGKTEKDKLSVDIPKKLRETIEEYIESNSSPYINFSGFCRDALFEKLKEEARFLVDSSLKEEIKKAKEEEQ